ncbi:MULTISPECIES: type II secretion system F family protein [Prauserella salsuginis group]|uniref:Type II secretion system F family protein n=1 Tax=Prauserella salsuginis TaxID=387889 RepID=A0ABW6FZY6_9PSEU|nr:MULTISPECIES: type II secretion system F family protein [Prauserella salsuginis group]MCR3721137.1 Type II secretion system (T2SS), protein F [Prauserella flava]MCR3734783.1 Type II secretion system (T2SS), protein F [Prauserella salsuginis]
MTTAATTLIAAGVGLGVAGGIGLIVTALRPTTVIRPRHDGGWVRRVRAAAGRPGAGIRVALVAAIGVLSAVGTGWIVGGVLAAAAVWFLPRLLGSDRAHARRLARIEAIAAWAEMLRDVLSAAAGLEQAILATAPIAPQAIRPEITALAARLESGVRLAPALRRLARELDDPTADLVLAALVLAAEHQARHLTELLGSLATAAREQAAMRMRVETGRARTRTSVRVIVATTGAFAAGVVVFNRAYLDVYNTPAGQLVLAVIGASFAAGFAWLARIGGGRRTARLIDLDPPTTAVAGGERP